MHHTPSMSFLIHESADEYHAKAKHYLSSHQLADFRKCPQLYYRKKTQPRTQEESPAYLVGRAAHVLILEGLERFREDFAVGGPINKKATLFGACDESLSGKEHRIAPFGDDGASMLVQTRRVAIVGRRFGILELLDLCVSDQKDHHAAIAMEVAKLVDELSPVIQGQGVALAVPTSDLFDRRGRFTPANVVPHQTLEPIERIDRNRLVVVLLGFKLGHRLGDEPNEHPRAQGRAPRRPWDSQLPDLSRAATDLGRSVRDLRGQERLCGRGSAVPRRSQHRDGLEERQPTQRDDATVAARRRFGLATIVPFDAS